MGSNNVNITLHSQTFQACFSFAVYLLLCAKELYLKLKYILLKGIHLITYNHLLRKPPRRVDVCAARPLRSVEIEVQICCVVMEKFEAVESEDADLKSGQVRHVTCESRIYILDSLRSLIGSQCDQMVE